MFCEVILVSFSNKRGLKINRVGIADNFKAIDSRLSVENILPIRIYQAENRLRYTVNNLQSNLSVLVAECGFNVLVAAMWPRLVQLVQLSCGPVGMKLIGFLTSSIQQQKQLAPEGQFHAMESNMNCRNPDKPCRWRGQLRFPLVEVLSDSAPLEDPNYTAVPLGR